MSQLRCKDCGAVVHVEGRAFSENCRCWHCLEKISRQYRTEHGVSRTFYFTITSQGSECDSTHEAAVRRNRGE